MKLCLILVLGMVLASLAYAETQVESVTVPPGKIQTLTMNVQSEDTLSGSFSVTGGSGNDIDFSIRDPTGSEVVGKSRVSRGTSFSVMATTPGAYTLVFDNSMSVMSSKSVQVSYTYSPKPIIGAPSSSPGRSGGMCGAGAILLASLYGLAIVKR